MEISEGNKHRKQEVIFTATLFYIYFKDGGKKFEQQPI